jgi:ABC-type thiamine transport system ATPase subunit
MTFDEALEELNPRTIWSDEMRDLLEQLRESYAPTVEMTKEQAEDLNSIIREVGEVFEPNEIPADVKLTDKVIELESSYILFKYLNAILHPETIKIVDE